MSYKYASVNQFQNYRIHVGLLFINVNAIWILIMLLPWEFAFFIWVPGCCWVGCIVQFSFVHFLQIGHVLLVDQVNHGYDIGLLGLLVHLSLLEFSWRYKSSDCPLLYITNSCMIFQPNMKCLFFSCQDTSVLYVMNPNFTARPRILFYLFLFLNSQHYNLIYTVYFLIIYIYCQELLTISYSWVPWSRIFAHNQYLMVTLWTVAGQTLRIACSFIIICKIVLFASCDMQVQSGTQKKRNMENWF